MEEYKTTDKNLIWMIDQIRSEYSSIKKQLSGLPKNIRILLKKEIVDYFALALEEEGIMNINEYLRATIKSHMVNLFDKAKAYPDNRPRVVCTDGFSISVQASEDHHCEPRENFLKRYYTVEIGYPSEEEPLLIDYAEDPEKPTGTIYGYVPVELVDKVLWKHGGIDSKVMGKVIYDFLNRRD